MLRERPGRTELPAASSGTRTAAISLLVFLVGLAAALPLRTRQTIAGYELALVVALIPAVLGWFRSRWFPNGFVPIAAFLASWSIVSAVAIWEYTSLRRALIFVTWMLVIVPGLTSLLSVQLFRNAFLTGFAGGVTLCVFIAATRLARGVSVFDQDIGSDNFLFGVNRNAVNVRVVILIPILLAGVGPRYLNRLRWPILALCVLWIFSSGGRAGLLGFVVVLLVYGLLQPGVARRARMAYILVLVALLGSVLFAEFGAESRTLDRLTATLRGERTDTDDTRTLLLKKARSLAAENPIFGVGYGKFRETHADVVETADTERERDLASTLQAHNTYAEFTADLGFPGGIAFVVLVLLLVGYGISGRRHRETRAWLCAFAGLMVAMLFSTLREASLYCTMAMVMALVVERAERARADTAPSLLSDAPAQEAADQVVAARRFPSS